MIEYIKLFNINFNINHEDILSDKDEVLNLKFDDMDIPENYEGSFTYSSNAKQAKKEIKEYLMDASENEKLFYILKEKIYNGDVITPEFLRDFSRNKNFDCKITKLNK